MRIGLDFDNTIACYDGVFHAAACARNLVPETVGTAKNDVRDYLNGKGLKDAFTELQGWVYGARMDLVAPYSGVDTFIDRARAAGHEVCIVSHKTARPIKGPAYNMHLAARTFLNDRGLASPSRIPASEIFFEETKEAKVAKIDELGCNVFVDDLPEILSLPGFPVSARGILFDPNENFREETRFDRVTSWDALSTVLLGSA